MTADVLFGVAGQELVFDHAESRPDAVTSVEVFEAWSGDDDVAQNALAGPGSVAAVQTTLDGAAGRMEADRRLIPLTATDGFQVGLRYHLVGASGDRELVAVAEIEDGVSVSVRHDLTGEYAAGDTFESGRVTVALDDVWVSDANNIVRSGDPSPPYRVRWVLSIGGATRVHDSYFALVRYAGDHNVTPLDVANRFPAFLSDMHEDDREGRGRKLIEAAWRKLKSDLAAVDIDDAALRDAEVTDEGVVLGTIRLLQEQQFLAGGGTAEQLEVATASYNAWLNSFVRIVTRIRVDTTGDGSGDKKPATRLTVR